MEARLALRASVSSARDDRVAGPNAGFGVGFKLDQLLVEPFHSFHAALVRHVYAADAILIGGYGFADVHINRALRNRLVIQGVKRQSKFGMV